MTYDLHGRFGELFSSVTATVPAKLFVDSGKNDECCSFVAERLDQICQQLDDYEKNNELKGDKKGIRTVSAVKLLARVGLFLGLEIGEGEGWKFRFFGERGKVERR